MVKARSKIVSRPVSEVSVVGKNLGSARVAVERLLKMLSFGEGLGLKGGGWREAVVKGFGAVRVGAQSILSV